MTESEAPLPPANTWDAVLDALRRRYPGQKESILFCIYKLQQNPDLTLRDFREEAELHRITTAGRALHSAKLLLGLTKAAAKAPAPVATEAGPRTRRLRGPRPADDGGASIETKVMAAVRQLQSAANQDAEQLRAAIRQAVAILQRAIGDG